MHLVANPLGVAWGDNSDVAAVDGRQTRGEQRLQGGAMSEAATTPISPQRLTGPGTPYVSPVTRCHSRAQPN